MKFSANLGFLWTELNLPSAILAAKAAGFDAVECHWPYDTDPKAIICALQDTNFTMIGLNTRRGDVGAGENGLSALPGREDDAKDAINEAISYAAEIKAKNIHVMAGFSNGVEAEKVFIKNLNYACTKALLHGITILIEPLNQYDAPGYFLKTTSQA
ncbi:TIM barrel protein, partial [Amylibacter sp.]|nr:TIM barrel protein [Amylibacter sp.]